MCKLLRDILHASDPMFGLMLGQLERASGNPGVDVRLSAEIIGKVHQKTRELGLDPRDTTPRELYHALIGLAQKHDEFLARRLGASDPSDVHDIMPRLIALLEQLDIPKTAWVIKISVAKRLLKETPPRKVMKLLGYRSIDSMLKREPIGELYSALRFVETSHWLDNLMRKYHKLAPSDFENRPIQFVRLDPKK